MGPSFCSGSKKRCAGSFSQKRIIISPSFGGERKIELGAFAIKNTLHFESHAFKISSKNFVERLKSGDEKKGAHSSCRYEYRPDSLPPKKVKCTDQLFVFLFFFHPCVQLGKNGKGGGGGALDLI